MNKLLFVLLVISLKLFAAFTIAPPSEVDHPGSLFYKYDDYTVHNYFYNGRKSVLYLPKGTSLQNKLTLIVFGHGYGAIRYTYSTMLKHIAKKGFAILFISYDKNILDADYKRMAVDYKTITVNVLKKYEHYLDSNKVVYSGHSNGALVATMAAGLIEPFINFSPKQLTVFGIPLLKIEFLNRLSQNLVCNFITGESDESTPPSNAQYAYNNATCLKKQFIIISSYFNLSKPIIADHGSFRTMGWRGSQVGPLHWYSYWKYILGSAIDTSEGSKAENKWLYRIEAEDTGASDVKNIIFNSNI